MSNVSNGSSLCENSGRKSVLRSIRLGNCGRVNHYCLQQQLRDSILRARASKIIFAQPGSGADILDRITGGPVPSLKRSSPLATPLHESMTWHEAETHETQRHFQHPDIGRRSFATQPDGPRRARGTPTRTAFKEYRRPPWRRPGRSARARRPWWYRGCSARQPCARA